MIRTNEKFDIRFIDASRLSTFGRCEARFLFNCLMGLRSSNTSNLNVDYGTVMHRVLPHMYGGKEKEAFSIFDALWARFGYGEEDRKRNTSVSRSRIINFVQYHKPDQCPYEILHFSFSAPTDLISPNEVPFLIDIGAVFPLCGRIDAVIRWKATGAKWAYDFKSSSEISPRYFDGFWFSNQACSYTIALSQLMNEKIEGLVIEAMRISERNIETQLGFVYVSDHNIRTFLDETRFKAKEMEQANRLGCWRQNNSLCSTYGSFGYPSGTCEFKTLCDSPDWETASRFYVRDKPFDPLKEKHEQKEIKQEASD